MISLDDDQVRAAVLNFEAMWQEAARAEAFEWMEFLTAAVNADVRFQASGPLQSMTRMGAELSFMVP